MEKMPRLQACVELLLHARHCVRYVSVTFLNDLEGDESLILPGLEMRRLKVSDLTLLISPGERSEPGSPYLKTLGQHPVRTDPVDTMSKPQFLLL